MSERQELEKEAADALRAAGRIPEPAVLAALTDEMLRDVIAFHGDGGPMFVA